MKRKHLNLSDKQAERLEAEAERLGINTSELIRRIIDFYFEKRPRPVPLTPTGD